MFRSFVLLIFFALPAVLTSNVFAYDFSNYSSDSEQFTAGSCTFNANYDYTYETDYGYGYGQVELQSRLPSVGYRYVGPKFSGDAFYDEYSCINYGYACDQNFEWDTGNNPQLTEANIESSCGITIIDGTFLTVNSFSASPQTYENTTRQSLSFDTATTSYFLEISTTGITKIVESRDNTAPSGQSVSFDASAVNGANASSTGFTFAGGEIGASYSYTISSSGGGTSVTGSGTLTTSTDQVTGLDLSGLGDGTLTVSVVLTDTAGNAAAAVTDTVVKDTGAPTVALTSDAGTPKSGTFTVTVRFSESVTGFALGDATVVNGTSSNFDDSAAPVYTFDVTPTSDGTVTVDIAAGVAADAAGNDNSAATQLSVTADGTSPTVTLTSDANEPHSGQFVVTATFSEDVTGFALDDIAVVNGTASNFVATSATVYTFDVTPDADGTVTLDVAAGVAADAAGNDNTAATQLSVTADGTAPTVAVSGPTDIVTEDFTVTVAFSEDVTGFGADDVRVANGTVGTVAGSGKDYTVVITPELGKTVTVSIVANGAQDAAGNGNEASNVFEVLAGSPASEFEKAQPEIKQQIVQEVQNALTASIQANVRMSNEAKSRFITSQQLRKNAPTGFVGQNNVPLDVTGNAGLQNGRLSSRGSFYEQRGSDDGQTRRVFFGDFSIVGEKGGSTTYALNGKMAWERMISDETMYGYFLGAEINKTDVQTSFEGTQKGFGANIGAYVVTELQDNVYLDGFLSFGLGKSDLEMSNGVLSLDGDYRTKSATLGGSITGVYDMGTYEFWPELAFTAGKTQIGDANFTGRAYGLVDNTLSLDAGDVAIANMTLRPEVRIDLVKDVNTQKHTQITYAPRLVCESVRTDVVNNTCGSGAELGFVNSSADGMTSITGRIMLDKVGNSTRHGLELKLQHQF